MSSGGYLSPEIVRSKLGALQQVLLDLKPHVTASRAAQEKAHYEIERQVQLAVDSCVAIGRRVLVLEGIPVPEISREVFFSLGRSSRITAELAVVLGDSVGLRNLLVRDYGTIDLDRFFAGLRAGYRAFVDFAKAMQQYVEGK